ncbi:uncharacterized protein (DUF427 family) [Methanohalophilus levihalophilus]|uniref:DUF427 domain-containing protein n=1 Tax=Methanohalophilus levihalophilus TaxID=1431282 RepID=UPI001AEB1E24|nr:DUF427 domain-containing protein [Methanohalophilus levihalophilus]MBP2030035.1 uncharacterized protein (DUF427 family) [Methanohalophilus levihalophilus]
MAVAKWNGVVIAESDETIMVEGNHYFPPDSVKMEYFSKSETTSRCPWKGLAHYYDITVNGETLKDGGWYYPEPSPAAAEIKDHVAFWKGVEVTD